MIACLLGTVRREFSENLLLHWVLQYVIFYVLSFKKTHSGEGIVTNK